MNATLGRVIASYFAPVERRMARLAGRAALILVAVSALVVAVGFLTAAGYYALAAALGVNWALLIVAAIYLVIAAFLLILALAGSRKPEPVAARPPVAAALEGLLTGASAEDAALLASLRLFGGMKPVELIGVAILAGFLAGRRGPRK